MSNIVRLATSRPVQSRGPEYPSPTHASVIEAEVSAVFQLNSEFYSARHDEQRLTSLIARCQPLLGPYAGELKREIAKALQPATVDEIRKHIVLLLDSNPRAQRLTESFGDLVESDVGALEPSKGAIEAACRHLRTNPRPEFKPVPDIPEIVDMVKMKQGSFERAADLIDRMPAKIEEATKQLDELKRYSALQRDRTKNQIRRVLQDHPSADESFALRGYSRSLIDEVRSEMIAERELAARNPASVSENPLA